MTRTVDETAFARISRAARSTVEPLEDRRLMAGDSTFVSALPFQLEFDAPRGGLADKNGNGIGFTWVQPNNLGNEYLPENIDLNLAQGILYLTSTGTAAAGGPWEADNTLTNSLQTQFNASTGSFTIRTRLVGPLSYIDRPSEQGGILFGPDQDNYVKLVAVSQPGGTFLQFIDEQKTGEAFTHSLSSSASLVNIGSFASIDTLDLEIVGDASTGKLQAFYRVNGGALTKLTQEVTLAGAAKANFFSSVGRAGLIAMHKNDGGPVTVGFDRFEIVPGNPASNRPSVTASRPAAGSTGVARDSFVAVDVRLPNPGHGVDAATLTNLTVKLYRTSDRKLVDATVNTTGGGDAIVLQPKSPLDANTSYTFEINDGVKDTAGSAFFPFVMTFTTGTVLTPADPRIAFEKVQLAVATGTQYSGLTIGPDGKLYGATSEGLIHRFDIKPDGTLGAPEVISTVQAHNGGKRFITGVVFDPSSTANNLILWVSHNFSALENAPDWTGKISRLTGADLATYQDFVVGLPRSVRDHLTNQMAFNPSDGKLYISQGSMSAMGAPDNAWGLRPENLLAGAILKLDTNAVAARIADGNGPLNVRTDGASPYNPFAADAPLKLYATGVRNAYDLVFHSNGGLYAPTNGSAAGGATPSFGGGTFAGPRIDSGANGPFTSNPITGIANVNQTENDYLHRIVDGGYYGHPNPTRGEFVQDGGNPTSGADYEEFTQYPVGTQPDRNYRGAAYVFGKNYSPNGVIEYKSDAFDGLLKGKLLVVRYSGGDDVVAMDVSADGAVTGMQAGITGLSGLVDPLDLIGHEASGNLYVSEYGASRITLLRPIAPGAHAEPNKPTFYFNDPRAGAQSPMQKVVIKNSGTAPLNINSIALGGTNAAMFVIVTRPDVPHTIGVGESVEIGVAFTAPSTTALGIKTAVLQVQTNDATRPTLEVNLRGLATNGTDGQNEPSLQRVFDLFEMKINTGDRNPANTNLFSNVEPLNTPNDELTMPRLVKAGAGPVTIEPIAMFGVASTPAGRLGYYAPGNPTAKTQLFTVAKADAQSVNPTAIGETSFDPGSASFGVYTSWPGFGNRDIYSEDSLNTSENNVSQRRKVRFYQLKDANGVDVPNSYVMAFEEFVNAHDGSADNQDLVAIIRNVMPAPAGAEIGVQNLNNAPFNDRMVFSRIQVQPPSPQKQLDGTFYQPPNNVVHDRSKLRVYNTGSQDLVVSAVEITGSFALADGQPSSFTILPGQFLDLEVVFTAQSAPNLHEGTLKLLSNDADEPALSVKLAGVWQSHSEGTPTGQVTEVPLAELVRALGYSTQILSEGQTLSNNGKREAVGEEVLSNYWQRADASLPVGVRQLAAFHRQGDTEIIRSFLRSDRFNQATLFRHNGLMGQSLFPTIDGSLTNPAQANLGTSHAGQVFGFRVQNQYSDNAFNQAVVEDGQHGHYLRFFPAKDADGKVIPNTWLMAMDYFGINYDYQDNLYLITNMRPADPAAPGGVAAETAPGGIKVTWAANAEFTATGYNVYRASSETGTYAKVNTGPVKATEFLDATAPGGVTSYYKVTAADDWGGESPQSAFASAARGADDMPPAAPQGANTTSRVDGVLVAWLANTTDADLMGYKVYRSLGADGVYEVINGGAVQTSTELLDSNTVDGTTYYYKVTAVDLTGNESGMSGLTTGTRAAPPDVTAPDAPAGVAANGQKNGIAVTWAANVEADVAGYRIFRAASTNGTYTLLTPGQLVAGTSYVDTTALTGTTYHYRVVAVDGSGNTSALSATASATRLPPDPVRINAAGTAYTDAQGNTWIADAGFTGGSKTTTAYDVLGTSDDPLYYTRRFGNFNYNLAMPDGAYKLNLHFADPAFTAAGKRKFDVFAEGKQIMDDFDVARSGGGKTAIVKGFNVSVTGGELNLKFASVLDNAILSAIEILPIGDTVAPSVPRRPAAAGSQAGVHLNWNDNADSDLAGYNVYRSGDAESGFARVNASMLTSSDFLDAAAADGAKSYYRITAVDVWGNESSPVFTSGTRPADVTPPATPANLTAGGSLLGISLEWDDNAEADLAGYNVYRLGTDDVPVKLNATLLTTSTFRDTAAAADAAGTYRVTAVDARGNESTFAEASAHRPPMPTVGTGLKGEYFDTATFTSPKLTRIDPTINFDWATGSPDASVGVDTFSVRWTGQIMALETGSYTFTLHADDGVRMWVNGVQVINKFTNAGVVKEHVSTPVQLVEGEKADIRIEYFDNTGGAYVQLFWQSSTLPKALVPMEALFAPPA